MVISWIVILLLLAIGLIYMKLEHHGRVIKVIVLVFLLFMILFSMSSILKMRGTTDYSDPKEIVQTVYYYFGWLGNTLSQLWSIGQETAVTVGNVVKVNESEDINLEQYDWKNKIKLPFKD